MSKNRSLRDQLQQANVKQVVLKSKVPANPGQWLKDGVDHINISRYSESAIGRSLNLDNVRHWNHPLLGPFRSLNTLWFFLKAKHKTDAIRSLTGHELKDFVAKRCGGQVGRVPNFRAVILHSAYLRLKACPDILAELVKSTLPFDCYRTMDSGVRVRFEHSMWFAGGHEEIRNALKENREPNFKHLTDSEGDIYDAVLAELVPKADPDALKAAAVALEEAEGVKKAKKKSNEKKPGSFASRIQDIDSGSPMVTQPVAEVAPEVRSEVVVEEPVVEVLEAPAVEAVMVEVAVEEALVVEPEQVEVIEVAAVVDDVPVDEALDESFSIVSDTQETELPTVEAVTKVDASIDYSAPSAMAAALEKAGVVQVEEPVEQCRGETSSLVHIDDASFVEPEFVTEASEPTTLPVPEATGRYAVEEIIHVPV